MKRRISFSGVFFCSVLAASLLSACGQKGDLYLPEPQHSELIVEHNSLERSENRDLKKKEER